MTGIYFGAVDGSDDVDEISRIVRPLSVLDGEEMPVPVRYRRAWALIQVIHRVNRAAKYRSVHTKRKVPYLVLCLVLVGALVD